MRIIFLIVSILLINNSLAFSAEKKDCSVIKKFSPKYLACKLSSAKEKSENVGLDTDNIKEKKYISDWFKKKKWDTKKI